MKYIKLSFYLSIVLLLCFTAPELHRKFIRSKVGSQVVMINNPDGRGGGTEMYLF